MRYRYFLRYRLPIAVAWHQIAAVFFEQKWNIFFKCRQFNKTKIIMFNRTCLVPDSSVLLLLRFH